MNSRYIVLASILSSFAVSPCPATADVIESSAAGFLVRSVVAVAAPPASVYDALGKEVGRWWDPAHTYSGDARNLSLDPRAGGCFCERLAGGGSVQHLQVVHAAPGRMLRLTGGLGPLQAAAVAGTLTWEVAAREGGSEVTLTYIVGGYRQGGLQELATPVDGVLQGQLQRLKNHVERGEP